MAYWISLSRNFGLRADLLIKLLCRLPTLLYGLQQRLCFAWLRR